MPWSRTFKLDGSDDAAIEDFVKTNIVNEPATADDIAKLLQHLSASMADCERFGLDEPASIPAHPRVLHEQLSRASAVITQLQSELATLKAQVDGEYYKGIEAVQEKLRWAATATGNNLYTNFANGLDDWLED